MSHDVCDENNKQRQPETRSKRMKIAASSMPCCRFRCFYFYSRERLHRQRSTYRVRGPGRVWVTSGPLDLMAGKLIRLYIHFIHGVTSHWRCARVNIYNNAHALYRFDFDFFANFKWNSRLFEFEHFGVGVCYAWVSYAIIGVWIRCIRQMLFDRMNVNAWPKKTQ